MTSRLMIKSKFEFIGELISNKKLDDSLRVRFLKLAAEELNSTSVSLEAILKRIETIELELKSLKNIKPATVNKATFEGSSKKKEYTGPNPKETELFLRTLMEGEGFKYLVHDFKVPDQPMNRKELLEKAKEEFTYLTEMYPRVPDGLIKRIKAFAFEGNPEWKICVNNNYQSIMEGWSSSNFSSWYDNQVPGFIKHPLKNSKWNKLLIEPFQNSIRIRDGKLLDLINECIEVNISKEERNQFIIEMNVNEIGSANFYTDVEALRSGLLTIFSQFRHYSIKKGQYKIAIRFKSAEQKCLSICHLNSSSHKILDKDFMQGDFMVIKSHLTGICNWATESRFANGSYRKFWLFNEDIKRPQQKLKLDPEGFTHKLYFY